MPNKDSFTFSDKLRKSKSVPLSKRLPSIVGGQNKQKRTLVQRAQRDLPFILVAACALLLLPFLSRNGNDEITGPGNFDWDRESLEEPFIEGGGGTLEPAGAMRDPIELILNPFKDKDQDSEIAPGKPSRDAYETSRTPRTDYSTRRSYDDEYKTKTTNKPATSKFGKTSRSAVRKSVERTPTKTRDLRISQMPSSRGATSTSHALPTGQAPKSTPSGTTIDPGVRPVALQRMEARGPVGRSMTGENLYAEAARSIGAMNAGGSAKANLLAAQMKDQDGMMTALDPSGAFGGAGSPRPGGAGGGPNNNNSYNIGKPWWWDMMQARSQKWWELFEYKWREMLWTNIYDIIFNGGKQIANCLLFGNKEVDVSNMFGASAGDPKILCEGNPNWKIPLDKYLKQGKLTSKTSDGKATEERSSVSEDSWIKICTDGGGHVTSKDRSDKGILQTRAECLGLDVFWSNIKNLFKKNKAYSANCSGVNNTPMEFTYTVTKKGEDSDRLGNKTVIALLAKHKNIKEELVVHINQGTSLDETGQSVASHFREKYPNCNLTRVVGFVSRHTKNSIEKDLARYNSASTDTVHTSKTEYYQAPFKEDYTIGTMHFHSDTTELHKGNKTRKDVPVNYVDLYYGGVTAAQAICKDDNYTGKVPALKYSDIQFSYADLGPGKNDSEKSCPIISGVVDLSTAANNKWIGSRESPCSLDAYASVEADTRVDIGAQINGVYDKDKRIYKYNVFAVVVEQIPAQHAAKVQSIINFANNRSSLTEAGTYTFQTQIGVLGWNSDGKTVKGHSGGQTSTVSSEDAANTNINAVNQSADVTNKANENLSANYEKCLSGCESQKGTVIEETENHDGTKTKKYFDYSDCISKCNSQQQTGNYSGASGSTGTGGDVARGQGRIIWIVTNAKELNKKEGHIFEGRGIFDIKGSDFVEGNNTVLSDVCSYKWCGDGPCDETNTNNPAYRHNRDNAICKIDSPVELKGCYSAFSIPNPKDDKKPFLIATTKVESSCANCSTAAKCTPVAWTKQPFEVYKLNEIPEEDDLPIENTNGYTKLTIPQNDKVAFDGIRIDAEDYNGDGNPARAGAPYYQLFPLIVTNEVKERAEQQIQAECTNIKLQWFHDTAYVSPKEKQNGITRDQALQNAIDEIYACQKVIQAANLQENYKTLYFIGTASHEGETDDKGEAKQKCGDGKQTPQQCNLALSEDRTLYAMDIVADKMNEMAVTRTAQNVQVVRGNSEIASYYGFNNTKVDNKAGTIDTQNGTYRYQPKYESVKNATLVFESVPLGSETATNDNDTSRSIIISFTRD